MSENYIKPEIKVARKRSNRPVRNIHFAFDEKYAKLGQGLTYIIETHGCQANEADSEQMVGLLRAMGFEEARAIDEADLIIINTCAVRETAESKVYGEIGRLKKYKRLNPNLVIAIGGCMPQEEVTVERILAKHRHVDIVFGTHNLYRLPELLHRVIVDKQRVIEVFSEEGEIVENLPTIRKNRYKAWVNIMFGCDEFCTYCIVPYTRGKERSRHPDAIVEEVSKLAAQGYMEVTLLGQNVNSYGLDDPELGCDFPELLTRLKKIPIPRIRFTTSHPKDFSDRLIDVLATGG
ncbi:MAG: MiaB/RimO family radical SAM methylthiotransferase, partial [Bacilli bacterium]|nr:MiaB/RimO family radical SAM methylthiotransferase [Bacilli bacterium]